MRLYLCRNKEDSGGRGVFSLWGRNQNSGNESVARMKIDIGRYGSI